MRVQFPAMVAIVVGFAVMPWDLSIARLCLAGDLPGEIRELLHHGELFGHAHGVLAAAVTVGVVSHFGWGPAFWIGVISLAAGLAADLVKPIFLRIRPCRLGDDVGHVWETFWGWSHSYAELDWQTVVQTDLHSLPSAHTATGVALAVCLSRLFPRGRLWFLLLTLLTVGNRVYGGAHYLSDTCWGAALGWCVAVALMRYLDRSSLPGLVAGEVEPLETPRHFSPANREAA